MHIQLFYFAQIRQEAGTSTIELLLGDQATVLQALTVAVDLHGEAFRKLILTGSNQLQPCIILLVNGIPVPEGIRTILKNGDCLSLFSPVAGG